LSSINGLIVPLLTPMNEDLSLDKIGLKSLTARLMNRGVKNFFVLSPLSETKSLNTSFEKESIDVVASTVGSRGNVLVGCFAESTDEVIDKVKAAERFSKSCVVNVPFPSLTNEVEFIDFFDKLFTKTKADIFLYNNPFIFKRNIPILGIDRIANWEKLIGIIDASRNSTYFKAVSDYYQSFKIFQAAEEFAIDSFNHHSSGVIVGLANILPELFLDLRKEFILYGYNHLVRRELKILGLMKQFFPRQKQIQSYKKILSIEGIIQEFYSNSLDELNEEEKVKLLDFVKMSFA
jgi:2-dehydro-3-deoxy-D-pentonate aldolase